MIKEAVIVDGLRSPIGNFGGAIRKLTCQELGRQVVRALMERNRLDPACVKEVIIGHGSRTETGQRTAIESAGKR